MTGRPRSDSPGSRGFQLGSRADRGSRRSSRLRNTRWDSARSESVSSASRLTRNASGGGGGGRGEGPPKGPPAPQRPPPRPPGNTPKNAPQAPPWTEQGHL